MEKTIRICDLPHEDAEQVAIGTVQVSGAGRKIALDVCADHDRMLFGRAPRAARPLARKQAHGAAEVVDRVPAGWVDLATAAELAGLSESKLRAMRDKGSLVARLVRIDGRKGRGQLILERAAIKKLA